MAIAPSILLQTYTIKDFKKAIAMLLPPGEYWGNIEENSELDLLITAMATELLITHEETSITFLDEVNKVIEGWKISDFQSILDASNTEATAFDDPNYPNLIFIKIAKTTGFLSVMQQLESHRLPHTKLAWKMLSSLGIKSIARPVIHVRLETQEVI